MCAPPFCLLVEVGRQCSNLAPDLQMLVLVHPAIRVRPLTKATAATARGRKQPRPVPRLTETMMLEAERRYKAKETLSVIARDLGVSCQRLAGRLRDRGVKIRREPPSPGQVDEMGRRYARGESLAAVGERLGFDAGTVRNCLIAAGVRLRDSHGRER